MSHTSKLLLSSLLILPGMLLIARSCGGPGEQAAGESGQPAGSIKRPSGDASGLTLLSIAGEARSLNAPGQTVTADLATLDQILAAYRRHHGMNPCGTNEEITAALRGKNPRSAAYLPPAGNFIDPEGQLVDRWGSPYFFHAWSSDNMDIISAGPDRELWSADDVIHRPGD